jgi:nitroreductase
MSATSRATSDVKQPDRADLGAIVEDACTAASLHNTQPWRWTARPDRLELRVDRSRHLPATDPSGRDLLISCGAALHTATVSAAGHGWATTVRRFPDPSDDSLLAVLFLTPARPTPAQQELAGAVRLRHSDRRPVSSWSVPDEWVETLRRVAAEHGVLATAALDDEQTRLLETLLEASRRVQTRHDGYAYELAAWTGSATPTRPQGVPGSNRPRTPHRFPAGELRDEHREHADPAPSWIVLSTSSDDEVSWLRTGEALAAQWLTCTVAGLSLLPFSQPVDVEVTRRVLQDEVLADAACPQLVVRLGWPPISREEVPTTPRRPVEEVLEFADWPVAAGLA